MKDQYVGDVNDYAKYGILRALGGGGSMQTSVCWARTDADGRGDGSRIGYLEDPAKWHRYDPPLFDGLRKTVVTQGTRSLRAIQESGLLGGCTFWDEPLPVDPSSRASYLSRYLEFSSGADLVFMDPDNGLEVQSTPRGSAGSPRYIYLDEVRQVWCHGHSILIYQHFPRVARIPYVRSRVAELGQLTGLELVVAFHTSRVLFLLAPQPTHWPGLRKSIHVFSQRWRGAVTVSVLTPAGELRGQRAL